MRYAGTSASARAVTDRETGTNASMSISTVMNGADVLRIGRG
jgi:hypothetical protein